MSYFQRLFRHPSVLVPDLDSSADSRIERKIPARGRFRQSANVWWNDHQTDALCLVALASIAFALGTMIFALLSPEGITLPQQIFGPAVMLAAGHGWVEPVAAEGSALQRFLYRDTD